ncbi:DUF805 domain-containing protein [Sulfurimonas sp. HSL3-2]|uniref:DUF805 domain-containing protein n=1 Tax=Hydrocurvibacter mobilis TaxID=3131936 RepID=UPI0031F94EC5
MKGKILHFDAQTNTGLIVSESGERYSFTKEDVKSNIFIANGMEADFITEQNSAKEIYLTESINSILVADVPYYEEQEKGFGELFSAQGCYTRWQYWKITLVTLLIWAIYGVMIAIMSTGKDRMSDTDIAVLAGVFIVVLLPLAYINIVTSIKRFHDINKSGWYYLFSLIPYVGGFILLVMNGFMPTVKEGNIYCRRKKDEV